jgi:FixJ family two-component response regulator
MSGLELQAALRSRGAALPVIVITAHGDVPSARVAFRAAALDFLEKPFDDAQLRAAIDTAFALEQRRLSSAEALRADAQRLERLTPREREVLELMAEGRSNAAIGQALVISASAVEKHISNVFWKLDLPASNADHRRVLAVLAYLQA